MLLLFPGGGHQTGTKEYPIISLTCMSLLGYLMLFVEVEVAGGQRSAIGQTLRFSAHRTAPAGLSIYSSNNEQ